MNTLSMLPLCLFVFVASQAVEPEKSLPGDASLTPQSLSDHMLGAILGAALGDALGRVTEFLDNTDDIRARYGPDGVTSFDSFKKNDWIWHNGAQIAPYTDDTLMSIIVLEEALKCEDSYTFKKDLEKRFVQLFGPDRYDIDSLFDVRAHGPTNVNAFNKMNKRSSADQIAKRVVVDRLCVRGL